jgi:small conductance mechanosensitive channel
MESIANIETFMDTAMEWLMAFLPDLITAIIILVVGLWLTKMVTRMVRRLFIKKDYDPTLESFLLSFISMGCKLLVFVLVVTQLGVKSSSLVAVVGAAGLAVGLALQGSLSNFAGGVLILLFKPFRVGDYISAQGIEGTVKDISVLSTKINTFGNQLAILPNGQLANNNIVNFNVESTRRDKITVGISYSSDIKKAKEILLQICNEFPQILEDPAPEVYVDALADSSVNLSLRFWAKNEDFWAAHFHVLETLKYKYDEAGIEIPFPHMVLQQPAET